MSGDKRPIQVLPNTERIVLANFDGVGEGTNPDPSIIDEVDTIQFMGSSFKPQNMLLSQVDGNLLIQFEGLPKLEIVLQEFDLKNLDNFSFLHQGTAIGLANLSFDQSKFVDSFDVFDHDSTQTQVFNPGTTTFLNDLHNWTMGFENADDVINGQGGHDTLLGLSGNDILRGEVGDDVLIGGADNNRLIGGPGSDVYVLSIDGMSQIDDFALDEDSIGLPIGMTVDQLQIQPGQGAASTDTQIWYGGTLLAVLKNIQASQLKGDRFVHGAWDS